MHGGKCLQTAFVLPKATQPFSKCSFWTEKCCRTCLHAWQTEMMSLSCPVVYPSLWKAQQLNRRSLLNRLCDTRGAVSASEYSVHCAVCTVCALQAHRNSFGKSRIASEEVSFTCNLFCGNTAA